METDPARPPATDTATAGVIARPPLLFLAAILVSVGLNYLLPLDGAAFAPAYAIVAGLLVLIGVALMAASIRNFSRGGTPVPTNRPTSALVTTGTHAWSRNPIYVGMFLIYAGIGVALRNPWFLVAALPLALVIRYGVVAREEAYLERRFGGTYRDYKTRVRRWL